MKGCRPVRGRTLLEMIVAMLLFVLAISYAVPAVSSVMEQARLRSAVDALLTSLHYTRAEAIRHNARVVLCKSNTGEACSPENAWEQGWIVFHDANGNGHVDGGERVLYREGPAVASLKISGNMHVSTYVAYTGLGRTSLASGAFQAGTITICDRSARSGRAYQIVISSYGRARLNKTTVAQCS